MKNGRMPDSTPLGKARHHVKVKCRTREGIECPCCGTWLRYHKRKFNAGMARILIWLVQEFERNNGRWINVPAQAPSHVLRSLEVSKLEIWGLAENCRKGRNRERGIWRPTELGIHFAHGLEMIPSYVLLFQKKPRGFSDEQISIREALGEKFDYDELMREHPRL